MSELRRVSPSHSDSFLLNASGDGRTYFVSFSHITSIIAGFLFFFFFEEWWIISCGSRKVACNPPTFTHPSPLPFFPSLLFHFYHTWKFPEVFLKSGQGERTGQESLASTASFKEFSVLGRAANWVRLTASLHQSQRPKMKASECRRFLQVTSQEESQSSHTQSLHLGK